MSEIRERDKKSFNFTEFVTQLGLAKPTGYKPTDYGISTNYCPLSEHKLEELRISILRVLDSDISVSGEHREKAWNDGWREILANVEQSGVDMVSLIPQYFKHGVIRFAGGYIEVEDPRLGFLMLDNLSRCIYEEYINKPARIVDLGSGTGHNLIRLNEIFPTAQIVGADWAEPSLTLSATIAERYGSNISGMKTNFFECRSLDKLGSVSDTVITSTAALEQLGSRFFNLLDSILSIKPKLVVQLEPISSLYNENTLYDYLALKYHNKRGYLNGYLSCLELLEKRGVIEIISKKRLSFGNMFHDPYTLIVWRTCCG